MGHGGHVYLNAALAEIGLDFPYREMQATLTVCLPASTSIPLIIDVAPFLPRATKRAPDSESGCFMVFTEGVLRQKQIRPETLLNQSLSERHQLG